MKIKKGLLSFLIASLVMVGAANTAFADNDQDVPADELKCRQELEQECELSQYGQTNCKQRAIQECKVKVSKKVVVVDEGEVLGKVHEPVDTALDLKTSILALMTMGGGSAALLIKRKLA